VLPTPVSGTTTAP